ncbi:hypothetical protein FRY97_21855 [Phaeodactylibacter luteus]|uniref:Uncharacterized protein n=1 Tax=Phaeodactylibacter luteus TaxID=1564516 RepID=A0A5C6RF79_9BACT|nr:hypothetical protein FRY97_21855 [Phaeodactylibacter luteus]
MLRGSLSARPLALQASGLAFGHPCAALGQCQASGLSSVNLWVEWERILRLIKADVPAHSSAT